MNLEIDKSNMYDFIKSWPLQFKRSYDAGFKIGSSEKIDPPRALVWAGMGGSAIGGDLIATLASRRAEFPVIVHRGGLMPEWIGKDDRVVLVSFSGNTAETLDAAIEAGKRGASIDLLTSGGKIESWGKEQGITIWKVEGGRPPRAALGDLFGFALGVLSGRGWIKVSEEEVLEAIDVLNQINSVLGETPTDKEYHGGLADLISERFPMIYGTGCFAAVARRWACQFNENSKIPAHWGELPEMNHNEVVAYVDDSKWADKGFVMILEDPDSPEDILKRVDVTLTLAEEAGWAAMKVAPASDNPVARMLELISTGDWMSYWAALSQQIDPTPIGPIDALKASLS